MSGHDATCPKYITGQRCACGFDRTAYGRLRCVLHPLGILAAYVFYACIVALFLCELRHEERAAR